MNSGRRLTLFFPSVGDFAVKKIIALLLFLLVAAPAMALDLGDRAPAISPEKWVTGTEVDPANPEEGTFFLVEVWSTTCPPCIRSIPIMNDIQKRYYDQGLRIVSFTTDSLSEVEPFLKDVPMEYASFIDREGATFINYMAADNRNTIPHAFLFDKSGILVWIGNPLDNLEARIKAVLDGTLNGAGALAVREARDALQMAFESQDPNGMFAALSALHELEPGNAQYYQLHLRLLGQLGSPPEMYSELFSVWFEGSRNSVESLMVLAMVALEDGHPDQRDPALALAAARRAFSLDSEIRLEAGLTLAETYKSIGRIDLSLETVATMKTLASETMEMIILNALEDFYKRVEEVGENPDAVVR